MSRSIAAWAGAANFSGAAVIFVYLQYLDPGGADAVTADPADVRATTAAFFAYITATMAVGTVSISRYANRWVSWIDRLTAPTEMEHRRTLQLPAFAAAVFLVLWLGAAVVFAVLTMTLGNSVLDAGRVATGIVFAGLVTSALGFVVVERAFRPTIAFALLGREDAVSSRGLGIRGRLGLAWALGSGVPLIGIGLAAATLEDVAWSVRAPIVTLVILGLITGGAMARANARAVAQPLEKVRAVVEAVSEGDLDASVAVDDGGEIGLLQIGVNRMVEATRERVRVQDLFGRHVGEAVARRAVDGGGQLGGQATLASVLFADVIGSTRLAQSLLPAEVLELLNDFFRCVIEATDAEGGLVNKFAGDGALCIFGPPGGADDHATRALAAARSLRTLLDDQRSSLAGLDAAIGVSTGLVVAGNVGSVNRFEYTVIGDPVNEASRLTEMAKHQPGRTLAANATLLAASPAEAGAWQPCGALQLRGRAAPTEVFVPASSDGRAPRLVREPRRLRRREVRPGRF